MAKKPEKPETPKVSKRVKINFDTINKLPSGFKPMLPAGFKPMDMTKFHEDDKKRMEDDKIRYKKELKTEQKRFNNLPCPSCNSADKKRNIISHMNGPLVCGGRNSSTIYADYLICQGCGTMYVDLHKKEVTPPYRGMFSPPSLFGH